MTNKWNASEIQNYSNDFAKLVCEEFFNDKESISGSEIINLTEIKQLNLFIIKELYNQWQLETNKFRSPYFDFSDLEVQKALEEFMNVISRHIKIKSLDFESLLRGATKSTIDLFVDPKQFFNEEMRNLPDFKLTDYWLKANGKFYKEYNWVLRELLVKLNGLSFVYANEAIDWISEIVTIEKIEDHKSDLKDIIKIIGEIASDPFESKNTSFFDSFSLKDEPEKNKIISENVIEEIQEPKVDSNFEKKEQNIQIATVESNYSESTLVLENSDEVLTLNELIQKNNENGNSLSEFHQKRKIESIKGNISLNQKFLFINNLFGGETNSFANAIDELEVCNTFNEAKEQMLKNYLPKFKWDLKSPEAEEFFDLLKRRYN